LEHTAQDGECSMNQGGSPLKNCLILSKEPRPPLPTTYSGG
jgi:hypothetical protein